MGGGSLESLKMDWKPYNTVCGRGRKGDDPFCPNPWLDLSTSYAGERDIKTDGRSGSPFLSCGHHYRRLHRNGTGPPEFYGVQAVQCRKYGGDSRCPLHDTGIRACIDRVDGLWTGGLSQGCRAWDDASDRTDRCSLYLGHQPDQIPDRSKIFGRYDHAPHSGHLCRCHRNFGGISGERPNSWDKPDPLYPKDMGLVRL